MAPTGALFWDIGNAHIPSMLGSTLQLNSLDGLELIGISEPGAEPVRIQSEITRYRGRGAVRVVNIEGKGARTGEQVIAIVKRSDLPDGTIEADLAGMPRQGAQPDTRGCRHCVSRAGAR